MAGFYGAAPVGMLPEEHVMKYRRLGRAGLKISELSFGSWLTFGPQLDLDHVKALMRQAFDAGVNFFDNAEAYAQGQAEELMGQALKDYRREDLVISTKLFWGGEGPNDKGLCWKHLMEGISNSLRRMQLDYVDLLYCHRPDPDTPMEETVRAMDLIVRSGRAFYWGTSEWSADELRDAYRIASDLHCIPPAMEQPQYNMFARERVEREYVRLYKKHGIGTTIWSPLASGILTGKYDAGVPSDSRLARVEWLRDRRTDEKIAKVRRLSTIASDLGCSRAQLAIAWCLRNENVSSVILGASNEQQLTDNLGAADVTDRLTPEVIGRIEEVLGNKP